jgi:rhamnulokinase
MAYVVFSSLAKSYKEAMADLEGITGEKYTTLNIIGGGSKNTLLNELTAKHTGRKIITGPSEGTAIGNLIMQMVGTGDLSGISEGRRLVKNSFEINEI